ncbi:hypothetical protein EB796_010131 [Bugula neritina]|uniref:Uncharacterized protein n=1 Tax=Bugula neritina TaxID=10212 RepID=A0A7J7K0U7_BUGNE|nr:hypothetical protein EB796_010131 [Bugula neritina]
MGSVHELAGLNDPHSLYKYGKYPQFSEFSKLVKYHSDIQKDLVVLGMSKAASSSSSNSHPRVTKPVDSNFTMEIHFSHLDLALITVHIVMY